MKQDRFHYHVFDVCQSNYVLVQAREALFTLLSIRNSRRKLKIANQLLRIAISYMYGGDSDMLKQKLMVLAENNGVSFGDSKFDAVMLALNTYVLHVHAQLSNVRLPTEIDYDLICSANNMYVFLTEKDRP